VADKDKGHKSTFGESVADYAKREMAEEADRAAKKAAYIEAQKRVIVELPAKFWVVADAIRSEIDTFNRIVDAQKRITLTESAGLAARADHAHHELNLALRRKACEAWVGLSELMRLGRAPATYIIEAHLKLSQAPRVRLRCEAIPRGEKDIRFRVTVDGSEAPWGVDELASRIVLAVAKDDPEVLGRAANPA
jgi:hypothetical protein